MQVSRDGKIPVARLEKYEEAIMSPAYPIFRVTTLIIYKKPGNTGISRDIRTEFTTDLLLSD